MYQRFLLPGTAQRQTMHTVATRKAATSGRFASLMELYESNYMAIRLLVPGLRSLPAGNDLVYVSEVSDCLNLELSRIEHEKYTSTFNLTYRFASDSRNPREPDLTIRIYHDARTCEVMSGLLQGTRHGPLRTRDLTEGYRLNRFLQKWIRYCLRQGHSLHHDRCHVREATAADFEPTLAESTAGLADNAELPGNSREMPVCQ